MEHFDLFGNGYDDRYGGGLSVMPYPTTLPAAPKPITSNWMATRLSHQLTRKADLALQTEHHRAIQCHQSMMHVTTLSALEFELSRQVPYAAERLKAMVDGYTVFSIRNNGRFGE